MWIFIETNNILSQAEDNEGKLKCVEQELEEMKGKLVKEEAKRKELDVKLAQSKPLAQGKPAVGAVSGVAAKAKKVVRTLLQNIVRQTSSLISCIYIAYCR